MFAWLCAMPFDVPKSVIQCSWESRAFGSFAPAMREIVARDGIRGLYLGLGPTLLRAFPANAALFLGYEMAQKATKDW